MEQSNKLTLTTNPLECEGNDEVATIWKDQKDGAFLIAPLSKSPGYEEGKEFGKKLVSAYNGSYGYGINPEAVPDLLKALKHVYASPRGVGLPVDVMTEIHAALEKAAKQP